MRVYGARIKIYCVLCESIEMAIFVAPKNRLCKTNISSGSRFQTSCSPHKYIIGGYSSSHKRIESDITSSHEAIKVVNIVIVTQPLFAVWAMIQFTYWGRDKMAAIFQTIFWNVFSRMKIFEFWLEFHWSLSNEPYFSIGSDNGLAPARRQAIIWTNYGYFVAHIGVARPLWVNYSVPGESYTHWYTQPSTC